MSPVDALLVCMPFGPVFSPSLGLSLLKASLHRAGLTSSVQYFSIRFAEMIGQHFYYGVAAQNRPPLVDLAGEWIFSDALAGTASDPEPYLRDILDGDSSDAIVRQLLAARGRVDEYLEWCTSEVVAHRPRVVGFTSVFQQHVASLALARRVKEALPETFIVFGGSNCEGVMGAETVRQFPFVDAVVSGEGEAIVPELVRRVLAHAPLDGLTGVRLQATVGQEFAFGAFPNTPVIPVLDELPHADFSDYMTQFGASPLNKAWEPNVLFETSRGCWWGAKHHCTFCGLNGSTMAFRSKSAARAVEELSAIARQYPGLEVEVVDNILDMGYFKTVLPELARRQLGVQLFFETKANLRKDQVRLLRDAGVTRIQPGIESLSDAVLTLMRKGVSAMQNIQLLKWCKELGVTPSWNIISGFPGEPAEDYARMAAIVPLLTHLPPPTSCSDLRLDRFSPNFTDADRLGFADVAPLAAYGHIYAVPETARRNLACYFDYRYRDGRDPFTYARPVVRAVDTWQRVHGRSDLFSIDVDGRLLVWDFRPVARQVLTVLTGDDRRLYQACDQVADISALPGDDIHRRVARLVDAGLMIADRDKYLALAVPVGEYQPAPDMWQRVYRELRVNPVFRIEGRAPRSRARAVHFSAATDGTVVVRSAARGPA